MALRNSDGTPYQLKGSLRTFDPGNNKTQDLLNRYDEEAIRYTGSPIFYYEVFLQNQTIDPLYLEDRGKLFSPCPIELWAFYEPPDQQNMSGMFAIDSPDEEVIFELNYRAARKALGREPKIGSRIYTPHRGENWVLIDYKLGDFKLWGAIRLLLHCRKFQETSTTGEGAVDQPQVTPKPDFLS